MHFALVRLAAEQIELVDEALKLFNALATLAKLSLLSKEEIRDSLGSVTDQKISRTTLLAISVQGDPEPQRNVFIRSDQYSFVRDGIPELMMGVALIQPPANRCSYLEIGFGGK